MWRCKQPNRKPPKLFTILTAVNRKDLCSGIFNDYLLIMYSKFMNILEQSTPHHRLTCSDGVRRNLFEGVYAGMWKTMDDIKNFFTKWHWTTAQSNSTTRHGCLCVLRHYIMSPTARPFITKSFRRADFNIVHRPSHPGIKTTKKLVKQRFVWPSKERKTEERTQETKDRKTRSGKRVNFPERLQISHCWLRHW